MAGSHPPSFHPENREFPIRSSLRFHDSARENHNRSSYAAFMNMKPLAMSSGGFPRTDNVRSAETVLFELAIQRSLADAQ
jgi:hypothetical protein